MRLLPKYAESLKVEIKWARIEVSQRDKDFLKDMQFAIDLGKGRDIGTQVEGRILESHIDKDGHRAIDKFETLSVTVVSHPPHPLNRVSL